MNLIIAIGFTGVIIAITTIGFVLARIANILVAIQFDLAEHLRPRK
jgi:hypothetical protein